MLSCFTFLLLFVYNADTLLCFNGTFSHKQFGEDPLLYSGIFSPSRRNAAQLRCASTIMCPVLVVLLCSSGSDGLLCYNCSTMHLEWSWCAGDFAPTDLNQFNNSATYLVNCTGDNAMCFVRVWSARAQHSWLVQRGCYVPVTDDPLPRSLNIPTRAMACKRQRLPEAEYKVCLCQANWCNSGSKLIPVFQNLVNFRRILFVYTVYKMIY